MIELAKYLAVLIALAGAAFIGFQQGAAHPDRLPEPFRLEPPDGQRWQLFAFQMAPGLVAYSDSEHGRWWAVACHAGQKAPTREQIRRGDCGK